MFELHNTFLCTLLIIAALSAAAAASPNLRSAGETTDSNKLYSRKLLQGTDDAEAPSPAEALTPVILAFMGIDDSGTDAAGNGTAATQGRGDGGGDYNRPYPPWDYCGSIRCNKYPNAVPVEGDAAAADSGTGSGATSDSGNGTAVAAPDASQQQGYAGDQASIEKFQGPSESP